MTLRLLHKTTPLDQKGQLTVFFATTILVMIGFIAFVINIGLFVKAKINLQNAVDAAAWSGAAVQARQLTNIGYLNWEMRNNYKEWMFKYYVIGNLSIDDVDKKPSGATTKFYMQDAGGGGGTDSYNLPSVCIHLGTAQTANICRKFAIPGVPRFEDQGIVAIDQTTQQFLDAISASKAEDCSTRSTINFSVNYAWAYNILGSDFQDQAPQVATHLAGAYPQALELALRMRNLEYQVNRAPISSGICAGSGNAAGTCSTQIDQLSTLGLAKDERPAKAFWAGYRNLGNGSDREMKDSFTLTELPPTPYTDTAAQSLSNLFIPAQGQTKHYLDLKLMPINLAVFYTLFSSTGAKYITSSGQEVSTDASCTASKVGVPVPGFPLGFFKNPNVVTYYAVKGEANFIGLFNPFRDVPIKLTAYAAAKPFGARIGPMLFNPMSDGTTLGARDDSAKFRSGGYISGFDISQLVRPDGTAIADPTKYEPGSPVPLDMPGVKFWVNSPENKLGGWLGDEKDIVFSIPNLVYDYPSSDLSSSKSSDKVPVIKPGAGSEPNVGLYNAAMFRKFLANMPAIGGAVSVEDVDDAILNVRAATVYDANNYLIPTPEIGANAQLQLDSFGVIASAPDQDATYEMRLYAPLYNATEDTLYKTDGDISSQIGNYIDNQRMAVVKYIQSMNRVAQSIRNTKPGDTMYVDAANLISDINFSASNTDDERPSCFSIAGRFAYLFSGDESLLKNGDSTNPPCVKDFKTSLMEYWITNKSAGNFDIYISKYRLKPEVTENLFSAYRPGPMQGANAQGFWKNTLTGVTDRSIRNYYSTKFVPLKALGSGGDNYYNENTANFPIMSEGNRSLEGLNNITQKNFANPLNAGIIGLDLTNVRQ